MSIDQDKINKIFKGEGSGQGQLSSVVIDDYNKNSKVMGTDNFMGEGSIHQFGLRFLPGINQHDNSKTSSTVNKASG